MKRVTAILLSVLCVVSLTSCAPASNDDALLTTPATDDTAIATLPPPIGDERMTELRVAIRYETDMNPLPETLRDAVAACARLRYSLSS